MPKNPMREVKLAKVVVHIGVGKSGEMLEKARKILQEITGQKPCTRQAKMTIKEFGIREGEPISCMTTLRGEKATTFMKRGLDAVGNTLKRSSFDGNGNFAFGIKEHIEIPGTKYVPELGIVGMDVIGTLERPGFRIRRRRIRSSPIGKSHRVSKDDAITFMTGKFAVKIREA
ncbi:MAG: 50S ribosomal protein L5 [Candidatus Bathyarchaeia archaeon]